LELSEDHKPGAPCEQARISASGGFVDCEGYLNGAVGVSRALGDWAMLSSSPLRDQRLKLHPDEPCYPGPLSGECEVRVHELNCEDEFLLLACDGLWDVLSSQAAVELARQSLRGHNDVQRLADELVKEAIARHSGDNVTVLVVSLSSEPPPARPPPLRCSTSASRLFNRTISNEALADVQRMLNGDGEGSGRSGSGSGRALAALEEGKLAALSLS
jgi:protein phosphatase 2C family protein 2/3